jgi:hypothetical protein
MDLSPDEVRLLRDVFLVSFAQLMQGSTTPEILTDLVCKGALVWHWNGGIPIYEVTDAGREAMKGHGTG